MIFWEAGKTLEDMERYIILRALEFYDGNRETTAEALGVSRRTIYNKLKVYKEKGQDLPRVGLFLEDEDPDREVVLPPNKGKRKKKSA